MAQRPVLLTGASGLLGTWLRRTRPVDVSIVSVTHRARLPGTTQVTADLRDPHAAAAAVAGARPSLVVHAAYAGDESSIVTATQNVVRACAASGAALLYVSTDAVFSGDGRARAEDSTPDPVSAYGRWKALAERLVAELPDAAIVRLPLVVSLDPEDPAITRLRGGAAAGTATTWFHDEIRQPAMGHDLAVGLWTISSLDAERRAGFWHLPGPERLSRHEIARRAAVLIGVGDEAVTAMPVPRSPPRPRDLHLLAERSGAEIGWAPGTVLLSPTGHG